MAITERAFDGAVRSVWNFDTKRWYFVLNDVVQVLTNTADAYDYTKKMRKADPELNSLYPALVETQEVVTSSGLQIMNCSTASRLTRFVVAIRAKNAKPFIYWVKSLQLDPMVNERKIALSSRSMEEFYRLLNNKKQWTRRCDAYLQALDAGPAIQTKNSLEVVFSLLNGEDFIPHTKGRFDSF